jgi:hypothetical protein
MAALFSPLDLLENKLDDNVATGNNTLANVAPGVVNDATLTTFSNSIKSLQENTDSGSLTFNVSDSDSIESTGNLLHASAMLNLPNGIQVPIAADCGTTTPITTLPVQRTCTINIPLDNATFWDGAVGSTYQGQFNSVATDSTNGIYATGVSANLQITVTDALGKSSQLASPLEVHVFSTKNDAPVVSFDGVQLPSLPNPNDSNNPYATYDCSITANDCGSMFHVVALANVVNAQPGPAAAFDELAMQSVVTDPVQCGADGAATQVAFANAPVIVAGSSSSQFEIDFQFTGSLANSSSLCTVPVTDAQSGGFPNSEVAEPASPTPVFRIAVEQ